MPLTEEKPPTATLRRVAHLFNELFIDPCEIINNRTIACGSYRLVVTDVERGFSIMIMKQGVTVVPTFEYFIDPQTDAIPLIVKRFIKFIGEFK